MKKSIALCVIFLAGCNSAKVAEVQQLSQVAKGWCLTIRASQVMPVYPLTEDVEVGDLFIVQKPLNDEVQEYTENGFLPLGQHLYRLHPDGLSAFYAGGTAVDSQPPDLSRIQSSPSSSASASAEPAAAGNAGASTPPADYEHLPLAAFPSYTFDSGTTDGANAELPIKGVPVALGLLGASSASVTLTLSDASSYGLDISTLDKQVRQWAALPASVQALKRFAPQYLAPPNGVVAVVPGGTEYHKQYNYLRIVTRVYFIKSVDITASNSNQGAFAASGGKAPALKLIAPPSASQPSATLDDSSDSTSLGSSTSSGSDVSDLLKTGGQVQFSSRTSTSVTMNETFTRPMVVGYLAYDLPIGEDGRLGTSAVSTQVRLFGLGGGLGETTVGAWAQSDPAAETKLEDWLRSPENRKLVQESLGAAHDVSGLELKNYLIDHAPQPWTYFIPIVQYVVLFREESVLYRKISEDIIRRPPGLQQPFCDAAS